MQPSGGAYTPLLVYIHVRGRRTTSIVLFVLRLLKRKRDNCQSIGLH